MSITIIIIKNIASAVSGGWVHNVK